MIYSDIDQLFQVQGQPPLRPSELDVLQDCVASLERRLDVYEALRNQEVTLYEALADQLREYSPLASETAVEGVVMTWLAVLRHCASAMLLDNPQSLEKRLLWFQGLATTPTEILLQAVGGQVLWDYLENQLLPQDFTLLALYLALGIALVLQPPAQRVAVH